MERSEKDSRERQAERTKVELDVRMQSDRDKVTRVRTDMERAVALAGASPPEVQLRFLKELIEDEAEAASFRADPKQYALDHGVLLEPQTVKDVVGSLLFEPSLRQDVIDRFGPRAVTDLLDMRSSNSVAAVPAAVVAGAAVVAAAAAVVTAVVTVVRTRSPKDLWVLKGLGPNGIVMPSGEHFDILNGRSF